ncbi:MAG: formate dehydrogenase subunit delta [Porticoccaceae bacterium]|nr:formate dehydrogenase subunit delta [Porticoccaceae bacterium]
MSQSQLQRLVAMTNQIALNMSANGDPHKVAIQVAQHLDKFWPPPMKDLITQQPATSEIGLSSIAQLAVEELMRTQTAKRP